MLRPARHCARRAGFSLIEALVVLAIGGMALAVIFSIGMRAGDTGFALGRRAMDAADADLAHGDLRAVLRSLSLRPRSLFNPGDPTLQGTARRIVGEAVMERATPCAPQGWAGRLTLEIAPDGQGSAVRCIAGDRQVVLLRLRQPDAAFSFSEDGTAWTSAYENTPVDRQQNHMSLRLFVRLAAPGADVIETIGSSIPRSWFRPDVEA